MGDYHVDRPGVEGGQPLELTGTNRPDTFKIRKLEITIQNLGMNVLLCAAFRRDRLELRLDVATGSGFWRP